MRGDAERLDDIREWAERAIRIARGRSRTELDTDEMLLLSLVKSIEIVGEAASHLSPAARERHPQVPWIDVVGMRHRLAHAYFDWNRDIVWETVIISMPDLLQRLSSPA